MLTDSRIRVVILAGRRDFRHCPLASDLPTALWPVAGKPVLERLLDSLADQGIGKAVICSSGGSALPAESIPADARIEVEFLEEYLPAGTAGAIRDAGRADKNALFIVYPAAIVSPPKIEPLLNAHRSGQCDLTVMFNPGSGNSQAMGQACGIYVCSGDVLNHIPNGGYFDIKERLIPEMVRLGKGVHAAVLPNHAGNFRDRREYLRAIGDYLESAEKPDADSKDYEQRDSQNVWIASGARVHSAARICEPAIIMDGANVSEGAVVLGPAILGTNVNLGKDAVVVDSVVWDNARLGANCQVQRSVIGSGAVVHSGSVVQEESIPSKREGVLRRSIKNTSEAAREKMSAVQRRTNKRLPSWARLGVKRPLALLGAALVLIAFLWCYSPELADLWDVWQRSDESSSGLLVPFMAVYVLWTRRHEIGKSEIRPAIWWGLLAFAVAQAFRLSGLFLGYGSAEKLSIVLSVAALVLLSFGRRFFRKVFTVLLFLLLMVPLPNRIQSALTLPLQRWATTSAVFCLEMAGYGVVQHGNVIDMEGTVVEVAWACNGLRMVTAFFVISGLVVLLVKRAFWEKLVIFVSSLPIALVCNTVRLTITAIAFTMLKAEQWEGIFHDFGGYAMMPLALAAVVAELWFLKKLTTPPTQQKPIVITRQDA